MALREPARSVLELDKIGDHLAGTGKRLMDAPHRAARIAARQRRLARPRVTFAPLPRPVDAQHEKGQPPRPTALKRRHPAGARLVTRATAPPEPHPAHARPAPS